MLDLIITMQMSIFVAHGRVLLQHQIEEQLKAKGIEKTCKWLEVPVDTRPGEFRPHRTLSIASSSSTDHFDVEYVDTQDDASYVPPPSTQRQDASKEQIPPQPEAPLNAPAPPSSSAGGDGDISLPMLLNPFWSLQ